MLDLANGSTTIVGRCCEPGGDRLEVVQELFTLGNGSEGGGVVGELTCFGCNVWYVGARLEAALHGRIGWQ